VIQEGERGRGYDSLFSEFLEGALSVVLIEPPLRLSHQFQNIALFAELVVKKKTIKSLTVVTGGLSGQLSLLASQLLNDLGSSLEPYNINFRHIIMASASGTPAIQIDNGILIHLNRGLDLFRPLESRLSVGMFDPVFRTCHSSQIVVFKKS